MYIIFNFYYFEIPPFSFLLKIMYLKINIYYFEVKRKNQFLFLEKIAKTL
nr:MAG TPA: hypothetical protein [Caudoviricetes sp.]